MKIHTRRCVGCGIQHAAHPGDPRRSYCPCCERLDNHLTTLLPESCRLSYVSFAQSDRPSFRCSCGAVIRSLRVLASKQHVELAASQLAVRGHIPPGSWELAGELIPRLGSVAAVVRAVQDIYGWSPHPALPSWGPADDADDRGWRARVRLRARSGQGRLGSAETAA